MRCKIVVASLVALVAGLSLPAARLQAAQWEFLESDGEVFTSIDAASLVREGDVVKAWVRLTFPSEQRLADGKTYQSLRVLTYYNCRLRLTADKVIEAFHGPENLGPRIFAVNHSAEELKWEEVAPESRAEKQLEFVCAEAP